MVKRPSLTDRLENNSQTAEGSPDNAQIPLSGFKRLFLKAAGTVAAAVALLYAGPAESHPEDQFRREWAAMEQVFRSHGETPTQAQAERYTRWVNTLHDDVADFRISETGELIYRGLQSRDLQITVTSGMSRGQCVGAAIDAMLPDMSPEREADVHSRMMSYFERSGDDRTCRVAGRDADTRAWDNNASLALTGEYLLSGLPGCGTVPEPGPAPECSRERRPACPPAETAPEPVPQPGARCRPRPEPTPHCTTPGGCAAPHETSPETAPRSPATREPQGTCSDGLDNDDDGFIDHFDRDSCYRDGRYVRSADEVTPEPGCNNGLDDDNDGLIDEFDLDSCTGDDGIYVPDRDEVAAPRRVAEETTEEPEVTPEPLERGPRFAGFAIGGYGGAQSWYPGDWYTAGGRLALLLGSQQEGRLQVDLFYDLESSIDTFTSHSAAGIGRWESSTWTLEISGGWLGRDAFSQFENPISDGSSYVSDVMEIDPETGEGYLVGEQLTDTTIDGTETDTTRSDGLDHNAFIAMEFAHLNLSDFELRLAWYYTFTREHTLSRTHTSSTTDTYTEFTSVEGAVPFVDMERSDQILEDTTSDADTLLITHEGGATAGLSYLVDAVDLLVGGDVHVSGASSEGSTTSEVSGWTQYLGGHEHVEIDGEVTDDRELPEGEREFLPDEPITDVPSESSVVTFFPSAHLEWDGESGDYELHVETRLGGAVTWTDVLEQVEAEDTDGDGIPDPAEGDPEYHHVTDVDGSGWYLTGYTHLTGVHYRTLFDVGALLDGRSLTLRGLVNIADDSQEMATAPWAQYLSRFYESEIMGVSPERVRRAALAASEMNIVATQPGITLDGYFTVAQDPGQEDVEGDETIALGGGLRFILLHEFESHRRIGFQVYGGGAGNVETGQFGYRAGADILTGQGAFYATLGAYVQGDSDHEDPLVAGRLNFVLLPGLWWSNTTYDSGEEDDRAPVEPEEE